MTRLLTQLRIDEISCVLKGANPSAKVMIRKNDTPRGKSFNEVMKERMTFDGDSDIDTGAARGKWHAAAK
jgi:hypothetical protein